MAKLPAFVGAVRLPVPDGGTVPESNELSSAVTVCGFWSLFSTLILPPAFTVIAANWKFWTARSTGATVVVTAAVVVVALEDFLLFPHAPTPNASATAASTTMSLRVAMYVIPAPLWRPATPQA